MTIPVLLPVEKEAIERAMQAMMMQPAPAKEDLGGGAIEGKDRFMGPFATTLWRGVFRFLFPIQVS